MMKLWPVRIVDDDLAIRWQPKKNQHSDNEDVLVLSFSCFFSMRDDARQYARGHGTDTIKIERVSHFCETRSIGGESGIRTHGSY